MRRDPLAKGGGLEQSGLQTVIAVTSAIYRANDRQSLFEAVNDGCHALGYDIFLLSCHKATRQEMVMNSTFTTVSDAFLSDYEQLNWFDDDVHITRAVGQPDQPFFWDASRDRYAAARIQSFIDYLHANAMCNGLMIPLHRRPGTTSVFSLIANQSRTFEHGTAEAAHLIGNVALAKAEVLGLCSVISIDEARTTRALSAIQLEILNWIAEGKSNIDISTIMNISERTVRYHVSMILRNLGVASRAQAAAIRNAKKFDLSG